MKRFIPWKASDGFICWNVLSGVVGWLAGPWWSKMCWFEPPPLLQPPWALQTAAFIVFCDFPNTDPPNKGTRYPWRSWLKHQRNVLLKWLLLLFFTSIWVHFLWSMTVVYSCVLETIRRQLIFHKQQSGNLIVMPFLPPRPNPCPIHPFYLLWLWFF